MLQRFPTILQATLTAPSGLTVPLTVTDTKKGAYLVEYTPTISGERRRHSNLLLWQMRRPTIARCSG